MDDIAKLALDSIRRPVRYCAVGQRIYDSDNETVLEVRGWGRLQAFHDGERRQDAIGEMVARMINEAGMASPASAPPTQG